jgi:hypothetical protein
MQWSISKCDAEMLSDAIAKELGKRPTCFIVRDGGHERAHLIAWSGTEGDTSFDIELEREPPLPLSIKYDELESLAKRFRSHFDWMT